MNQLKTVSNVRTALVLFVLSATMSAIVQFVVHSTGVLSAISPGRSLQWMIEQSQGSLTLIVPEILISQIPIRLFGLVVFVVSLYIAVRFVRGKYVLTHENIRRVIRIFISIQFVLGLLGILYGLGVLELFLKVFSTNGAKSAMDYFALTKSPDYIGWFIMTFLTFSCNLVASFFTLKKFLTPSSS